MPPYNGNPSQAMVRLMNSFRMKPGWIVWNGYLHVWVSSLYWKQLPDANDDFRYAIGGVPATLELELFKAYRVYYEQLRCELPYPYAGPRLVAGSVRSAVPVAVRSALRRIHVDERIPECGRIGRQSDETGDFPAYADYHGAR